MRKRIFFAVSLLLAALLATPAAAMEYTMSGTSTMFGTPTSITTVAVNVDVATDKTKDGALVPPAYGSPASAASASQLLSVGCVVPASGVAAPTTGYTAVTADMYYSDDSIGRLIIPTLGVDVRIYEGTGSSQLAKGAGHFATSSIWNGNVALAGHNRGVNSYFGKIHTLAAGDRITLVTALGTRSYSVTEVSKIPETDGGVISATASNCITLISCVSGQPEYRWYVRAVEA